MMALSWDLEANMAILPSGLRPEPRFFFAPRGLSIYKQIAFLGQKVQTPPSPLDCSSPRGGQNQVGISDFGGHNPS